MAFTSPKRFDIAHYFLVMIVCFTPLVAKAQIEFDENFGWYPPPSEKWNFCQTARRLNSSTSGQGGLTGTAYRIGINGFRGTATCICGKRQGCLELTKEEFKFYSEETEIDEESELYPISLLNEPGFSQFRSSTEEQCKNYTETRVPPDIRIQKNEIRLWKDSWPDAHIGYWHSFRFRVDGRIDRCGSMRWVGGQIKAGDGKKSPVIAQRFDNGVFHVTIETPIAKNNKKSRRFIVAKSGDGNPDAGSRLQPSNAGVEKFTCDLTDKENLPARCKNEGVIHTALKPLPTVKDGEWVQMDYYVKLEGACKNVRDSGCRRWLDIWSQGEKVATVQGNFGADNAHMAKLKFKFGVYRDLQAGDAGLIIDQFTLRKDPEKSWCPKKRISSSNKCD